MPALVAGIHVFLECRKQDVDGRDKSGHDDPKFNVSGKLSGVAGGGRDVLCNP